MAEFLDCLRASSIVLAVRPGIDHRDVCLRRYSSSEGMSYFFLIVSARLIAGIVAPQSHHLDTAQGQRRGYSYFNQQDRRCLPERWPCNRLRTRYRCLSCSLPPALDSYSPGAAGSAAGGEKRVSAGGCPAFVCPRLASKSAQLPTLF